MNPEAIKPAEGDNDSGWLNKGYITYTLFDGSWNAPQFGRSMRRCSENNAVVI